MTSIIVVLPAPFGPMMQRSSPGSTYERQVVERLEAVEADGQVFEVEDLAGRGRTLGCGPRSALSLAARRTVSWRRDVMRLAEPAEPISPRGRNNVTSTNSAPSA